MTSTLQSTALELEIWLAYVWLMKDYTCKSLDEFACCLTNLINMYIVYFQFYIYTMCNSHYYSPMCLLSLLVFPDIT